MKKRSISVLIADDHPVVRRGIKEIIADTSDIAVTGEAATAAEVLAYISRDDCDCDVLCLDLTMPGSSGLELLHAVRHRRPRLPVLVLSMHPEDQYGVRVLRAGAAGYLTKESAPDGLVDAIRKVCAGGMCFSAAVVQALVTGLTRSASPLHDTLSDRELQVLCLLAKGLRVTRVAQELSLSVKTISTYRTRVLGKMGMQSTADLIRYALQNRLVD